MRPVAHGGAQNCFAFFWNFVHFFCFFFAHFVGTELGASARFDRVSMLSSAGALGSEANAEARAAKARRRKTLDSIWTGGVAERLRSVRSEVPAQERHERGLMAGRGWSPSRSTIPLKRDEEYL